MIKHPDSRYQRRLIKLKKQREKQKKKVVPPPETRTGRVWRKISKEFAKQREGYDEIKPYI